MRRFLRRLWESLWLGPRRLWTWLAKFGGWLLKHDLGGEHGGWAFFGVFLVSLVATTLVVLQGLLYGLHDLPFVARVAGFASVEYTPLTMGIAHLHMATKAG